MAEHPHELTADAELILRVRDGDATAYEALFLRHREAARRYALSISSGARADDLVADAFTKIFDLLQRGKGPDVAFRAYLLTVIRTGHLNEVRAAGREHLVGDHDPLVGLTPVIEDPDHRFDQAAITRAFRGLPARWQTVLWMTLVEDASTEETGDRLGISANAVASLAYRARAGLRQAYLAEHVLRGAEDDDCREVLEQLPRYLHDRLGTPAREHLEAHLEGCPACLDAAVQLADVETALGGSTTPAALADLKPHSKHGAPRRIVAAAAALGTLVVLGAYVGQRDGTARGEHPHREVTSLGPLRNDSAEGSRIPGLRVAIPVGHPVAGTTLVITTVPAAGLHATSSTTDWDCRAASSTLRCTYDGRGADTVVRVDVDAEQPTLVRATLVGRTGKDHEQTLVIGSGGS